MNQELVKEVALTMDAASMRGYAMESVAEEAIKATGRHLLSELEGSESPCEMRAKIVKECGLEAEGWLREPDVPRDLCPDCARGKAS